MMLRYCSILLAVLLAATPVVAAEGVASGEVSVGLNVLRGDDNESAKLHEYRDLSDGVVSGMNLFLAKDGFYLNLNADKIGRDDQSYSVKGGRFDSFKLSLFYDEMEHNYSFDNISVFTGVGTNTLGRSPLITTPLSNAKWRNLANWLPLDYSIERQNYGGKATVSLGSPFFFSVEVNETEKDGVIPFGTNSVVELPLPVDYKTTNFTTKAGYATKTLLASVDWTVSSFENGYDTLNYPSPGSTTVPAANGIPILLAPDNDMWQVGGQLVLKQLPLKSTLALRGSHSQMESDATLDAAPGEYDGDVTYTTASASLRSLPIDRLETELSYRYVKKDNEAKSFDYRTTGGADAVDTHIFYYTKHNAAVEAAYRLTDSNRIALGYDYTTIDRAEMRFDAEETTDHLFSAEWKNTSLDFLTAKLRYEHLNRNSDFDGAAGVDATDADTDDAIRLYHRPFDTANKEQDKVKLALDLTPCDHVDLGIEYNYKLADYDKTLLGRTDERSHEVMIDASMKLPAGAKLYGYFAYEKAEIEVDHRRYNNWDTANVAGSHVDPFGTQNTENYNWTDERTDKSYYYGAKLEVPLFAERLKLTVAYDYQKSDGESEFSANVSSIDAAFVDISKYDDYVKKTLNLKADYALTEALSVAVGYLYESYRYDDVTMDNYRNQPGTTFYYLTGAYSDPEYKASTTYLTMAYKF